MKRLKKPTKSKNSYPALYEKIIPIAIGFIAVAMLVLIIIIVVVELDLLPNAK